MCFATIAQCRWSRAKGLGKIERLLQRGPSKKHLANCEFYWMYVFCIVLIFFHAFSVCVDCKARFTRHSNLLSHQTADCGMKWLPVDTMSEKTVRKREKKEENRKRGIVKLAEKRAL
jgi:hypothetical protein